MIGRNYYSLRMHASVQGRHCSGAERIVTPEKLDSIAGELIARALAKDSSPDHIVVTIDDLSGCATRSLAGLDVTTIISQTDPTRARQQATRVLQASGVALTVIGKAFSILSSGAAPSGGTMRGAMVMDALTGERLEPDQERGVRATRFDWADKAGDRMRILLADRALTHPRTYEAIALASKIAAAPGYRAELCWSDDPDYTAGYVASHRTGYVRFPCFKRYGDPLGGRAVFIDRKNFDLAAFLAFMEKEPAFIDSAGQVHPDADIDVFLERIGDVRTGS